MINTANALSKQARVAAQPKATLVFLYKYTQFIYIDIIRQEAQLPQR